ncbi:MAG: GNAT family N-acetyltransferase [Myxococcales bacterium]|nr:MAG: GNAT family N-acetyltransferase [Myxococcales bacterium]
MNPLCLIEPCLELLPSYADALERGWSPDTTRDVAPEQLAHLRSDPAGFIASLTDPGGTILLADGQRVPRLPARVFWIDDGEFCGAINLRYQPGTAALPPHCPGHIGYAIVPWKRGLGHAKAALAMVLPVAREVGLPHVVLVCDESNVASRHVIEASGGDLQSIVLQRSAATPYHQCTYRIAL